MIEIRDKDLKELILNFVSFPDYLKGETYYPPYIEYVDKRKYDENTIHTFDVESERTTKIYECKFTLNKEKQLLNTNCTCPQFQATKSCKHIAACLVNHPEKLLNPQKPDNLIEIITKQIFKDFKQTEAKIKTKQEIKLEVIINCNSYEHQLILKIGLNKLYMCKQYKLINLLEAIENNETYTLGKSYTYDPETQYFNEKDMEIINFVNILSKNNQPYNLLQQGDQIKNLIRVLKNKTFTLNDYKIKDIKNKFPLKTHLNKVNNKYILDIDLPDDLIIISPNIEYIQQENTLYHLTKEQIHLLYTIIKNDINKLIFTKEELQSFKNSVLPIIKNNIEINETIKEIKITNQITPELYFDLYKNKIICNLKFKYDDTTINYFDKNTTILRNNELENNVLEDLLKQGFKVEKNKIIITEIEDIAKFLEENLITLSEKYKTYTTEKLKNTNIIKKQKITSTFSIGKDGIMSYNFDIEGIKSEEIVNIFKSLKDNKKYYRLKSGDILNIENNQELKDLHELTENLDLTNNEISTGTGEIPKYKAIYLDSLKQNSNIIKTNNQFDELIQNFRKYKNSKITLSKKQKEIVRPYQEEGIKWLYNIDKSGFGGILADEMGLGKSLQTIYFLEQLIKEKKEDKFLIVVPTSLAYNWENEIKKFAPNIKYKVLAQNRKERRKELDNIKDTNILITTYGLLREDKEYYQSMTFRVMIIDEGQNIKNSNTEITKTVNSIKAQTKFALTGTPIENSVAELWSIFNFIMPGFLGTKEKFEGKYRIKDFDENTNKKLDNLSKLINPFILRRKKQDVIKDLPDKIENNIYIELTKEQKKIYLAELEKIQKETDELLKTEGITKVRFKILTLLTKLRQICINPSILYSNYNGGSGKIEELTNIVKNSVENGHKILIFTSFLTALNLTREHLEKQGITSYTIDGNVSSKKRNELVNKFNKDNTNVFFITLKAGGTGLNLTGADTVIHLDLWWNPQAENQATDRAHRIGQKNTVQVIKLITKGTIEEKILELQNKKKLLSDKLIDSNNNENIFSKLTEKDIKELLSYENMKD